jgi:hypothetical protein
MKKFVIIFMVLVDSTNAFAQFYSPIYIPPPVPVPRWWQQQTVAVPERPEYAPLPPRPVVRERPEYAPLPPPPSVPEPVVVEKEVPVPVPVPTRKPVCTTYPDPWDTLGYIFGDPFMITTCY